MLEACAKHAITLVIWTVEHFAPYDCRADVAYALRSRVQRAGARESLLTALRSLVYVSLVGAFSNSGILCLIVSALLGHLALVVAQPTSGSVMLLAIVFIALSAASAYNAAMIGVIRYPILARRTFVAVALYIALCTIASTYLVREIVEAFIAGIDWMERHGSLKFTNRGYLDFQISAYGFAILFMQCPLMALATGALVRGQRNPPYRFLFAASFVAFLIGNATLLVIGPFIFGIASGFGDPVQVSETLHSSGPLLERSTVSLIQGAVTILICLAESLLALGAVAVARKAFTWHDRRTYAFNADQP